MKKEISVEKRQKFLLYLFCMCQIILVNESAYTLYVFGSYKAAVLFDHVLIFFILLKIFTKKIKVYKSMVLMLVLFIMFILVSMVINNDFHVENFLVINAIINGFFISSIFDLKSYLKAFKNCIIFFSIYGLIVTYIMLPMGLTSMFVTYYNPGTNIPYFNAGFSFVMGWNGLMRLQGIFREPGVFQIYILLSIMIEMFVDKKNIKNIIVLLISMVMTFSTSLLVSLIPFFSAIIIRNDRKKFKFLLPLLILLLFVFTNIDIRNHIMKSFSKLTVGSTESTDVRYNSIKYMLEASLNHPLFGSSYVHGYYYIRNYYMLPINCDITGTFITNIMAGGYIYGMSIILLFYKFVKDIFGRKNILISLLLFTSLFLSICSQNIVYSSIIWTIIFFEIKLITIERKENHEKGK